MEPLIEAGGDFFLAKMARRFLFRLFFFVKFWRGHVTEGHATFSQGLSAQI
jgi:hypothetical protein